MNVRWLHSLGNISLRRLWPSVFTFFMKTYTEMCSEIIWFLPKQQKDKSNWSSWKHNYEQVKPKLIFLLLLFRAAMATGLVGTKILLNSSQQAVMSCALLVCVLCTLPCDLHAYYSILSAVVKIRNSTTSFCALHLLFIWFIMHLVILEEMARDEWMWSRGCFSAWAEQAASRVPHRRGKLYHIGRRQTFMLPPASDSHPCWLCL